MGGAIEVAQKARLVGVVMMHTDSKGNPKILSQYTLPLTAEGRVDPIYTDLAVFDVAADSLYLCEIADRTSIAELWTIAGAAFHVPNQELRRF